jgi:hypothetical protein
MRCRAKHVRLQPNDEGTQRSLHSPLVMGAVRQDPGLSILKLILVHSCEQGPIIPMFSLSLDELNLLRISREQNIPVEEGKPVETAPLYY